MLATPINNPALAKKAGFPANALNVNMTTDGHMSWMMTKAEIQRQADYNRNYLDPARKQVAASLTDGLATTSSALFGVSDTSTLMVSPNQFLAQVETDTVSHGGTSVTVRNGTSNDEIMANFNLPAGAIITGMTAYGYETSATDDPVFYVFYNCPGGTYNGSGSGPSAAVTAGFVGGAYAVTSATSDLVVDNSDCVYEVYADTSGSSTDVDQIIYGVALRWKRQVSPDPAVATFLDVPVGAPFHREIEALASSGITAGCNGGNYCPGNPVTRGQMAAFLARGLGLHWKTTDRLIHRSVPGKRPPPGAAFFMDA